MSLITASITPPPLRWQLMTEAPDTNFDDSNMYSEIIVEFFILDFTCSHDGITKALGVAPTHTWFTGDHVGRKVKYRRRHEHTGWLIASDLPRSTVARDQLRALLDRLHLRSWPEMVDQPGSNWALGFGHPSWQAQSRTAK